MNKNKFGELILHSQDSLYRIAKSILYKDDDCYDAIQEAIIKGFTNLHSLKNDKYAKTWLIRILINECNEILRHNSKEDYLDDKTFEISYEAQDYSFLYEAVMKLSKEYRICIVLFYIEGYKIKEIASIINSTESAVKKRLSRAKQKLRDYLEGGN